MSTRRFRRRSLLAPIVLASELGLETSSQLDLKLSEFWGGDSGRLGG